MAKRQDLSQLPAFSSKLIGALADEVAKTVIKRLPTILPKSRKRTRSKKNRKIEGAVFLDTSAIIDGRIFEVVSLGLLRGDIVVLESILLELKHIADSQDAVKRERGRNGLDFLEQVKKTKGVKLVVLSDLEGQEKKKQKEEVDEKLIRVTKLHKGRIVTCDYNLEKKATIQGVIAVNVNALANSLKIRAVPGEALHIKILHKGKDVTQGVGYLDDGTMIVVENASEDVGKMLDAVVARVIQTTAGRILFAKKI